MVLKCQGIKLYLKQNVTQKPSRENHTIKRGLYIIHTSNHKPQRRHPTQKRTQLFFSSKKIKHQRTRLNKKGICLKSLTPWYIRKETQKTTQNEEKSRFSTPSPAQILLGWDPSDFEKLTEAERLRMGQKFVWGCVRWIWWFSMFVLFFFYSSSFTDFQRIFIDFLWFSMVFLRFFAYVLMFKIAKASKQVPFLKWKLLFKGFFKRG